MEMDARVLVKLRQALNEQEGIFIMQILELLFEEMD